MVGRDAADGYDDHNADPLRPQVLRPKLWSFVLSDLTVICAWALVVAVYVAEPEGLRDVIARPSDLTLAIAAVVAVVSIIAFASMTYRRFAPSAFALRLDREGIRWRHPYAAFWVHRHRWIDIDLFHAPRSIANLGTARFFKRRSVLTVSDRPSPFDRSLPSNYGLAAERVAELLETRRQIALEQFRRRSGEDRRRRDRDRDQNQDQDQDPPGRAMAS